MVADDDQDILDMLTTVLIYNGYHVHTSFNGETLDALTEDTLPDLLLLDIWMSGLNGRDVCIALKGRELTKNLPIVLISANHDIAQVALEAGADGYVAKPFNIKQLLDVVKLHLNGK
ncbi:hypothetical protein BH09BAC1_BH09BAC1_04590 [soil metagenome]